MLRLSRQDEVVEGMDMWYISLCCTYVHSLVKQKKRDKNSKLVSQASRMRRPR